MLDELGKKYGTDKASVFPYNGFFFKGHDYLKYYELLLESIRKEKFVMVELGCDRGSSVRMWKEYFPFAHVVAVDCNEELKSVEQERVSFVCSDATDDKLLTMLSEYRGAIKFIVDDCSHAWADQRRSFEMLFPILNGGGYYIVEDLECGTEGAYPDHIPKVLDAQPFWDYVMDRIKILRVSDNRDPISYRPFFINCQSTFKKLNSLSICV